jgi:hypothetical protein
MKKQTANLSDTMQRLTAMAKAANPDDDGERFDDAEAVVARYEQAVIARSLEGMPTREELGIACFWLSMLCGEPQKAHLEFAAELLTPSLGMSLFECLPTVLAIRDHAFAVLAEIVAAAEREANRKPVSENDLPF